MRVRVSVIMACALLCLAPTAAWALAPYSQDFEGLTPAPEEGSSSLADDGWLVFGNVFSPDGQVYYYGYGPFPAPNHGGAFSAVDSGQGGPEQGEQQLSVFSDYNNGDHQFGNLIESNVFQEQVVDAANVGQTWLFQFDAKRGNIEGATTAKAFIKTLNPAAGFALTNFIWIDMTNVSNDWERFELSIFIDPSLEGQILQIGFLSTATNYEGSGVFYDNVAFLRSLYMDIKPGSCPSPLNAKSKGKLPAAVLGTDTFDVFEVDPSTLLLEGVAPIRYSFEDVSTPYMGAACGCTDAGPDGFLDMTLKFKNQDIIEALGGDPTGVQTLTLTGALLDGTPFASEYCVTFVSGAEAASPTPVSPLLEPPSLGGLTIGSSN